MSETGQVYRHPRSGDKYKVINLDGPYIFLQGLDRGDNLHIQRQLWEREWKHKK